MDQGIWLGYNWIKPKNGLTSCVSIQFWYSRLVTPIDYLKRKNDATRTVAVMWIWTGRQKLWWVGANVKTGVIMIFEARVPARCSKIKGKDRDVSGGTVTKQKLSWGGEIFTGTGGVLKKTLTPCCLENRFNSKFHRSQHQHQNFIKQPGWAGIDDVTGNIFLQRRDLRTVENVLGAKYSLPKMGINLRIRHYWSKVAPQQFYQLNDFGKLVSPTPLYENRNQNYNYLSTSDMVYTWQFTQGSFINIVWKDIAESFNRDFEKLF